MANEQMELDLRLEYEKTLKENIQKTAEFAEIQIMDEERPKRIESQHEAFGVLCSKQAQIGIHVKAAGRNIADMLNLVDEGDIRDIAGSLYNSCIDIAVKAVITAAHCRRALDDLYYSFGTAKTPIEEAIEAAADGFEEAAEAGEPAVDAQEPDPAAEGEQAENSAPETENVGDGAQGRPRDLQEAQVEETAKTRKRRGRKKAGVDNG